MDPEFRLGNWFHRTVRIDLDPERGSAGDRDFDG
jgi:hypothetical protein